MEGATSGGRVATRAGWVVAALLPPAAAVKFVDSPWIAALIVLGGEIGLAALAFAAQVFGLLRTRWAERLAERIDVAVGTAFSRFDKEYRRWVRTGNLLLDQQGLLNVGAHSLELAEVFVDVSLAPRPLHQVDADPLAQIETSATRRSIWEFLERQTDRPARLAIVAGPGCGKSTLVAHVALELAVKRRNRIPVLLALRDHAERIAADPQISLAELIRDRLGKKFPVSEPPQWWERRLATGRCLVMLDGLDEVGSTERRRAVVGWVTEQMRTYHRNDFVATSRPYGYQGNPLPGMTTLTVRNFTPDQVATFVRRWSLAIERRNTGAGSLAEARRSRRERRELDVAVTRRAEDKADLLLKRLKDRPELYELTVNPLLLTMIANVHRFKNALPAGRVDLYGDICDALLWSRQEAKGITDPLTRDQKAVIVQFLAWELMDNKTRDASGDYVVQSIEKVLPRVAEGLDPTAILRSLTASGLLVEREADTYAFAHHSLQEYSASVFAREGNGDLVSRVDDPWWSETILLYAAKADATEIVTACLQSNDAQALALAFECKSSKARIRPAVGQLLTDLMASVEETPLDAPQRTVLTAAILTEWFGRTVRLENGRRLSVNPVPGRIYRLFQQEEEAAAQDRSPDLPRDMTVDLNDPAMGMRYVDARAFAEWARSHLLLLDIWLPSASDLRDPAARQVFGGREYSIWTEGEGSDPWTTEGGPHPRRVGDMQLRRQLARDFAHVSPLVPLLIVLSLQAHEYLGAARIRMPRKSRRGRWHYRATVARIDLGLDAAASMVVMQAMGRLSDGSEPMSSIRRRPYLRGATVETLVTQNVRAVAETVQKFRQSLPPSTWSPPNVREEWLDVLLSDLLQVIDQSASTEVSRLVVDDSEVTLWPIYLELADLVQSRLSRHPEVDGMSEYEVSESLRWQTPSSADGWADVLRRCLEPVAIAQRRPDLLHLRKARLAAAATLIADPVPGLDVICSAVIREAAVLELRATGEIQPSEVIYLTRD